MRRTPFVRKEPHYSVRMASEMAKHVTQLPHIAPDKPVLIAGPTASGKSSLALRIAEQDGGRIINADASQVFECWRILTARPTVEEEKRAPHALYGHLPWTARYSAGHWLRDVVPLLSGPERPIIVGGTGLYFAALTQGMADIPETPSDLREAANSLPLAELLDGIDGATRDRLDQQNRARVQRAYEVQHATGRSLSDWQADTPPPVLPVRDACALVLDAPRDWLQNRIASRFDQMLRSGALDEVRALLDKVDPRLPAFKAIGVPELTDHLRGKLTLEEARLRATIATRQFAKRQRTWFRARMQDWTWRPVTD